MARRPPNGTNVMRDTGQHIMLCFAKMKKGPFTLREAGAVFPKFDTIKKASAVANALKAKGYLVKHEEEQWQITETGIELVYRLARRSKVDLNSND